MIVGEVAFAVLVWGSLAAVAVVFAFLLVMLIRGRGPKRIRRREPR